MDLDGHERGCIKVRGMVLPWRIEMGGKGQEDILQIQSVSGLSDGLMGGSA